MPELPFIPETITVHLGPPDSNAENVTLPFLDYIANVASSEIYPTWPENAIRANIYAQVSFALNRVYTEYYRTRGYDFDITNFTGTDQSFVNGRVVFENVRELVGELFNDYIRREGSVAPLFAAYCNGTTVTCAGLSQWGTVELANQGYTPFEILTYYYGDNIELVQNAPIAESSTSAPYTDSLMHCLLTELIIRLLQGLYTMPVAQPSSVVRQNYQDELFEQILAYVESKIYEPLTVADGTLNIDIAQKLHFDLFDTVSPAGFTAAAFDIEAEAAGQIAPDFGFRHSGKEFADKIERSGVSCRIAPGSASDGTLVDDDGFIDVFQSGDLAVTARSGTFDTAVLEQSRNQNTVDE